MGLAALVWEGTEGVSGGRQCVRRGGQCWAFGGGQGMSLWDGRVSLAGLGKNGSGRIWKEEGGHTHMPVPVLVRDRELGQERVDQAQGSLNAARLWAHFKVVGCQKGSCRVSHLKTFKCSGRAMLAPTHFF